MARFNASPALKRKIKERFNFECAVCDPARPLANDLTAEVAHLFEDATTRHPGADRLIVLCANCNQGEARSKSPSKPSLSELFSAEEVSLHANKCFREGRYPCAYQGHRLAAYIWENHSLNYSKAVASLADAISAARPIRWGDLLSATVLEVERLCLSRTVGVIQRWLFLDRLALVLWDYRRWDEAARVQSAAAQLRRRVTEDPRDPGQLWLDQRNSFRRELFIQSFARTVSAGSLRSNLDELIDDAKEFKGRSEFDAFATNLDVAGRITHEIGSDLNKAHNYAEEALAQSIKVPNKWVLQEHCWRNAEYYNSKSDRPGTVKNVIVAFRLLHDYPIILEPTIGAAGPAPRDPSDELRRFGIDEGELREHGVAPSGNPPSEIPLRLSTSVIDRIVRNCMKACC